MEPSFQNKRYIPPWKEPYIIGIAGSSGSGKTSIASSIIKNLNVPWTVLLSMDNFYQPLSEQAKALAFQSLYDLDAPEAIDLDTILEILRDLKAGKKVRIPTYSFVHHDRTDKYLNIYGANVVIIEGIYALYDPRIVELMDLRIFVDTDLDVCLARRLTRDILHRGRELSLSVLQWNRFVKPNYERYIRYTMTRAHVVTPRGLDNTVAINMLTNHIKRRLQSKSEQHVADLMALGLAFSSDQELAKFDDVVILPQTSQVQGIHTILFDSDTCRDDFIFYFDRIASILVGRALDLLTTYSPRRVETPNGHVVQGVHLPYQNLCAVTLIRGGECLIRAMRSTVPDIRLGKLLIQSDSSTGEPKLHTLALPPCIDPEFKSDNDKMYVVLLDTQLASGTAATMAVAVLLDHGIREEHIILVAYSAAKIGIVRVKAAFPKVKVVVGRTEDEFLPRFIDARYFGTD